MEQQEKRILLVDDEQPVLDSLKRNLRNQGYIIDAYSDAQQALGVCELRRYDLIISDFKMPGMDGLMFLTLVKKILPDSTRFLLTSHTEAERLLEAIRNFIVHKFVLKPWDPSELRFLVARTFSEMDKS